MLGIFIILFSASIFGKLAKRHNRKPVWVFYLIPIATYYTFTFIGGVSTGLLFPDWFDIYGDYASLKYMLYTIGISMLFGVTAVASLYYLLSSTWSKVGTVDEVID